MKEQIKAPEKIQLSDEEIVNLSDAQFKTCNQDAHKNDWVWSQNGGKIKAMQSEMKRNVQGTNSKGKETGNQIKIWSRRKK